MPPRRLAAKAGQKHEMEAFAEKYDTLVLMYGDPVEMVFAILAKNSSVIRTPDGKLLFAGDDEIALRAAEMLMSYRYPRVKSAEGNVSKAPVLNFNVTMPAKQELPVNQDPPRRTGPVLVVESKRD